MTKEKITYIMKMARKGYNDKSVAIERTLMLCSTDEERKFAIEAADAVFAVSLEEILMQIEYVDNLINESKHLEGVNVQNGMDDLDRLYLSAIDAVGRI